MSRDRDGDPPNRAAVLVNWSGNGPDCQLIDAAAPPFDASEWRLGGGLFRHDRVGQFVYQAGQSSCRRPLEAQDREWGWRHPSIAAISNIAAARVSYHTRETLTLHGKVDSIEEARLSPGVHDDEKEEDEKTVHGRI